MNHADQGNPQENQEDQFRQLRYNLLHSCSWLTNGMRQILQPHEITPKQFNILRILEERKPDSLSIQEVRELLADKMSDASRLIDRLDKKNLITKFPSDTDRRSNRARIAEEGSDLLRVINNERKHLDSMISDRLNPDETATLIELLGRLK